jgi:uncharacterized membrane protein
VNGRGGLAVLGVAVILASIFGGGVLPHQWFGITTETLVGWLIVLFVPGIVVTLLLVIAIQQWQMKRGQAYIAWRLGMGPAPQQRGKVIPLRRRSG